MTEKTKTYHWAMIQWCGKGQLADEVFVQVVKTTKGEEAALDAAREWGRKNLAPTAGSTVRYIGKSDTRTVY
ncbi:hypothetical protein ACZ90_00430 [Streptomyces albus subsp. albus]|nr:hypothetical protein ACZ90_00430 [Streptomyces albus subsp. albus]